MSEGVSSEGGTGIIKEAKVLLLLVVSSLCLKGGNMSLVLLLLVAGQHPCALPKGCSWRTQRALLLQSTGKTEGSGRCMLLCPHRLATVL